MNLTLKQPALQEEVVRGGAIELLVPMLSEREEQMEEVAGALTNLADTHAGNQAAIARAGAVAPLVRLLGTERGNSASNREEAAGALMNLSACEENKAAIVAAAAVAPLVALLADGTQAAAEHAAGALANLAAGTGTGTDAHRAAIFEAGALPLLLAPLAALSVEATAAAAAAAASGDAATGAGVGAVAPPPSPFARVAASALLLLVLNARAADALRAAGGVRVLVCALRRGVPEAAGALMNLARGHAETQAAVVAEGALPDLVSLLATGSPEAQEEAAGALLHVMMRPAKTVAGAPQHQRQVAEAGAVLPLVMLLSFGTPAAREQAAAALGQLASGHAANRRAVLDAEALPALLEMVRGGAAAASAQAGAEGKGREGGESDESGGRREAAGCLRCLLEGETLAQAELVEAGGLAPIASLLQRGATREAASGLLGVLHEGFAEAIEAAKG